MSEEKSLQPVSPRYLSIVFWTYCSFSIIWSYGGSNAIYKAPLHNDETPIDDVDQPV